MLATSIRVRQLLGTRTAPFQLTLRSSVLSVAVAVVLVALVALAALVVLIVSVAVVAAAVVAEAVAVAALNISRFPAKSMFAKVPAVVAGTFLYQVKHMKQAMVHRMIVLVIILIWKSYG